MKPNGGCVTSVDGVELDYVKYGHYEFICEEYGAYEVIFYATDAWGNEASVGYAINIRNTNGPKITLSKAIPQTVSLGTFKIPTVRVTDDLTPTENIVIAVSLRYPDGTCFSVKEKSVKLTQKGKYLLTYLAIDGDGNISFLDSEFTVK
jgi:hypothetical protein